MTEWDVRYILANRAVASKHPFPTGCAAFTEHFPTPYSYQPSLAAGVTFLCLFGLSSVGHLWQGLRCRRPTSLVFAAAATIECLVWAARTWSSICPYILQAFLIQFTTVVVAPSFILVGAYLILRLLMIHINPDSAKSSCISANTCFYILLFFETTSLVVQILGAALTARALDIHGSTKLGTRIMEIGSIFQLVSIFLFFLFSLDFIRRIRQNYGMSKAKLLVGSAMTSSVFALLLRSIYRTALCELGWKSILSTDQPFLLAFDGSMVVLAVAVYNFIDPAILLPQSFRHKPCNIAIYVDDGYAVSEFLYRGTNFEMQRVDVKELA